MNPVATLSSDPFFHRLGFTLVQFLWQGTFIALLHAALRAVLPRSRPSARYVAGCVALGAMLILPAATFWETAAPEGKRTVGSDLSPTEFWIPATPLPASTSWGSGAPFLQEAFRSGAATVEPWLLLAWIAGVPLLSVRFFLGWAAVERLRRRWVTTASVEHRETLERIARRLRVSRPVRLLESAGSVVPAAFGIFKPVILLPLSSLSGSSPDQIEAVLAHELAHIRRHDYLVNLFQNAAETLFFYHPAVWWVSRCVRVERENCCDDLAVTVIGDARRYARALLALEETRAAAPQVAVAAGGGVLWRRIARLLAPSGREEIGSRLAAALLGLAILVTLGAAAKTPSAAIGLSAVLEEAPAQTPRSGKMPSPPRGAATAKPPHGERATRPASDAVAEVAATEAQASDPPETAVETDPATLTPGQLATFSVHGVTAEFVGSVVALGYSKASVNTLVSLRTHGVSADFIREANEVFGERLSLERCIELRIHGVSPAYAREMGKLLGKLSADQAQSLRIHGVTADYVQRLREAGGPVSVDQAITMRNHGVDPSEATEFVRLGFAKPSLDDLLTARNHGLSTEYIQRMRDSGLAIRDLDMLVALRVHGVTPDFARAMRLLGFSGLSADDAIALRNHGVDADFVREIKALGYTGATVDQLISLRNHGVTPDFIRKANATVRGRLSVDELIDRRIRGREE